MQAGTSPPGTVELQAIDAKGRENPEHMLPMEDGLRVQMQ